MLCLPTLPPRPGSGAGLVRGSGRHRRHALELRASRHNRWQARVANPRLGSAYWYAPGDPVLDEDRHIVAYRELLAAPCEPPSNLNGDGVIYAMFENNDKADLGIQVGIALLREVGWQGRVQFWHVGHCPRIDPRLGRQGLRRPRGSGQTWRLDRTLDNQEFCPIPFWLARTQWLDWDAMNVCNPQPMFDALEKYQVIYWTGGTVESQANTRWPYNPENPPSGLRRAAHDRADPRRNVPCRQRAGLETAGIAAIRRQQLAGVA